MERGGGTLALFAGKGRHREVDDGMNNGIAGDGWQVAPSLSDQLCI